jgi:hypothetical protein
MEPDPVDGRARSHDELVFEPAFRAVDGHVDSRPQFPVDQLVVSRKILVPPRRVVAEQVADAPRPRVPTLDDGGGVGAREPEPKHHLLSLAAEP